MCQKLPVRNKTYCWLFMAGLILVLAAASLWLATEPAAPHRSPAHLTPVVEAVTYLQNCTVCHLSPLQQAPMPAGPVTLAQASMINVSPQVSRPLAIRTPDEPAESVSDRLIDIGQRLLDVSAEETPLVTQATGEFLMVVDVVTTGAGALAPQTTLQRIAYLESLLRDLEQHANATHHWREGNEAPAQPASLVGLVSGTSLLVVLVVTHTITPTLVSSGYWHTVAPELFLPAPVVHAISRRGPPAVACDQPLIRL